jgi:hypothetical protein
MGGRGDRAESDRIMAAQTQPGSGDRSRAVRRLPLLLWAVVLAAAAVGGIIAVAEIGTGWMVALAVAALLATTASMMLVVEGFLTDEEGGDRRPARAPMRLTLLGVAAIAVAALVIALVVPRYDDATAATSSGTGAAATQTIREFLVAAYVDGDGDAACGYLSLGEQDKLAAAETSGACSDALEALTTDKQVRDLPAGVTLSDGAATVRIGGGVFVLRPATGAEQSQFGAPPTYWRIASGVSAPPTVKGSS